MGNTNPSSPTTAQLHLSIQNYNIKTSIYYLQQIDKSQLPLMRLKELIASNVKITDLEIASPNYITPSAHFNVRGPHNMSSSIFTEPYGFKKDPDKPIRI
ncbi:hypothetical protein ACTFIW_002572 [Dictyostelium discoideum]